MLAVLVLGSECCWSFPGVCVCVGGQMVSGTGRLLLLLPSLMQLPQVWSFPGGVSAVWGGCPLAPPTYCPGLLPVLAYSPSEGGGGGAGL